MGQCSKTFSTVHSMSKERISTLPETKIDPKNVGLEEEFKSRGSFGVHVSSDQNPPVTFH